MDILRLIFHNSFGALGLIASTYIENKSHVRKHVVWLCLKHHLIIIYVTYYLLRITKILNLSKKCDE